MSEEIKINKNNKSITFINNGIAFSQFGIADEILDLITNLQTQLQQKENIIKEVREYIGNDFNRFDCFGSMAVSMEMNYKREELLEKLDKVGETNDSKRDV